MFQTKLFRSILAIDIDGSRSELVMFPDVMKKKGKVIFSNSGLDKTDSTTSIMGHPFCF